MSDLTERLEERLRPHCGVSWSLVTAAEITPFIELELLRARLDEHSRICSSCRRKLPRESGCLRGGGLEGQIRELEGKR